jgi:phage/plasmid-associated DNA primase
VVNKLLLGIVKGLNRFNFRKNVLGIFQTDNYVKNIKWNQNKNLFVFEDCVYDLSRGEFSDGTDPADYVNQSCGKPYRVALDAASVATAEREMETFLRGCVLPADYDYLLKLLASFLKQENKEERGHFMVGKGRNSKGTICEAVKNALGRYWGELNMDYYTNHSKEKDRPNQNLYNCRDARVLNSSEVADDNEFGRPVKFISSAFKTITGGDDIYARELGTKNTAYFKAGKVLIQTNQLPTFTNIKGLSLRERIVVMNFPYVFTDKPELLAADPAVYKPRDSTLKDKFGSELYRVALTNILFRWYPRYVADFSIPPSIMAYTNTYFDSESITAYLISRLEPAPGERVPFGLLKEWVRDEYDKKLTTKALREELEGSGYAVVNTDNLPALKGFRVAGPAATTDESGITTPEEFDFVEM